MSKYENGDIVTYYFIIFEDKERDEKRIQGWTDDKSLAKIYLEFHNCKHLILKSVTKTIDEIAKILEENRNDEIQIVNINVRNREKHKKGEECVGMAIPATRTECQFINEETANFLLQDIRYSYLNTAIPYLKNKYQSALNDILLWAVIKKVCDNKENQILKYIELDQLLVLFRSFPDLFGK